MSSGHETLPRDARLIALMLASTPSIEDAQPAVLQQLLEFSHRYTSQVLGDAMVYADHAGRSGNIQMDDVTLAVQSRVGWEFGGRVPKEHLLSLATRTNAEPLPQISETYGVRLPPAKYCLTQVDFDLVPNKPPPQEVSDEAEDEDDEEEDDDDDDEGGGDGDDAMDEDTPVPGLADTALGLSTGIRMSDDEGDGDGDGEALGAQGGTPNPDGEGGSDEESDGGGDALFGDDDGDDDDEEVDDAMDVVNAQSEGGPSADGAPTEPAALTNDPQVGEKRKLNEDDEYD